MASFSALKIYMLSKAWILLLSFALPCASFASAEETAFPSAVELSDDVAVYLRDPVLCDGILSTQDGGVITAPGVRIQALKLEVDQREHQQEKKMCVRAEGELMVEHGDRIFTGSSLNYNFQEKKGRILNGRGRFSPWYSGAECIELLPGGEYLLYDSFLSTSSAWHPEWRLCMSKAYIDKRRVLTARNVQLRLVNLPLLWIPLLKVNLNWLADSPVRYRIRWGGRQGLRVGISYKLLDWKTFQTYLRLDYRFSRGPGTAIETVYCSPDGSEHFSTRNYVARDSSVRDPERRFRYRMQGVYDKSLCGGLIALNATYDKISDEDMPSDYSDRDLELETAKKTQISLRSQTCYGIANIAARIRVNTFETVKEDLPAVGITLRPLTIPGTGIISENRFHFGYHDFRFSKELPSATDYNSTRVEFCHHLYRSFAAPWGMITPEAGAIAIFYGNSRERSSKWVTLGTFGVKTSSTLHRYYGAFKHVVEPYIDYQYYTKPNTGPDEHFIFDVSDGLDNLNTLRLGCRHLLYEKKLCGSVVQSFDADMYSYAFINTSTIDRTIPKLYTELGWNATPSLRYSSLLVWNYKQEILDEYNLRAMWTASDSLAIDAEYRHRSDFRWRKVDPCNFVLDSFRTETALRASALSDRRSTAIIHAHCRLDDDLALELRYRHGWRRRLEPDYNEYQVDVTKMLRSSWQFKVSYQHRESDHRIAIHIKMGQKKPSRHCCPCR